MYNFEFILPTKIRFGEGVSACVADEIITMGHKRPMLVTDTGLMNSGLVNIIIQSLVDRGLSYTIFDKIESNPRDLTIEKAYKHAKNNDIDCLVAIGGGSSMDSAKAIGILLTNGGVINDYEGIEKFTNPICDLICIPTTCGTGAEVTFWSVITDTKRHYKMSIGSPKCAAKVALVDPELIFGLPSDILAATGMDALSHAIEGYTCTAADPVTDAAGIYAIKLIGDNIRKAVFTDCKEAKGKMLLGSLLAGVCFGNSDIAGVHCMGEALGGLYDTAHGVTMALFLPYVTEFNYLANIEKYADIAVALGERIDGLTKLEAAKRSVSALQKLCDDLEIPTMKELGVKEEDLDELAIRAFMNVSVDSNPRKIDQNDFLKLFKKAYSE